jgi:hypothetical protein
MTDLNLHTGDWVEIRSKEEILKTLDKRGQLDGLPFMPQMFQYCGKQFKVFKRAHKTCDTVNQTGGRRMSGAIHLELRCDGAAYGGCPAGCLLFWKEAWLKRIGNGTSARWSAKPSPSEQGCTEQDVWKGTRVQNQPGEQDPTYVCQATQVPAATTPLAWWDIRQYAEDYRSGNVGLARLFRGLLYAAYYNLSNAGIGVGRPMRWFYDSFQGVRGGLPYPRWRGVIPAGERTPHCSLNLQPGEWVRVRPYKEILATLDTNNKNRGLYFDAEAVPFCGGTYRVLKRLNKLIDEKTGKLLQFKNDCIVLEDVWCRACYSDRRMFCPRAIYSYWREIWLERVKEPEAVTQSVRAHGKCSSKPQEAECEMVRRVIKT